MVRIQRGDKGLSFAKLYDKAINIAPLGELSVNCRGLVDDLCTGNVVIWLDLGRFWARRVKRLAPAALTVTAAAILFLAP